jgi:glycosyltransferase involved in cell wall biosynthesis
MTWRGSRATRAVSPKRASRSPSIAHIRDPVELLRLMVAIAYAVGVTRPRARASRPISGGRGGERHATPAVLLVGEGPPRAGGIPTFLAHLRSDPWLNERVELDYLNTTHDRGRQPGAATLANVRLALRHTLTVLRRARRVDLVHLNLAPAPALPLLRAVALSLAARAGGARVILHAHTGRLEACLHSRLYRVLFPLALRAADLFVVVSRPAEGAARRFGGNVARLENGVDPAEFGLDLRGTRPVLMAFVGTVCERKGLIDLRDALVRVGQCHESGGSLRVVVAGDGAQEGPGAFERVKEAYREVPGVEFAGRLGRQAIVRLLEEANIFCLPSHWEGFPLSLLEAMAAGTAVIATSVGDVSAMLDGGRAGVLVPPHDPGRLAEAIERLATDPGERRRLGSTAKARVQAHYQRRHTVETLYRTYLTVLSTSTGEGASRARARARSAPHST